MSSIYLPTLKQLQYFVALHDYGHFGRAADACCVTQSTLSAGLRELESLIGMCRVTGVRPRIDVELPLAEAREGFGRMLEGRTAGKIVFTP